MREVSQNVGHIKITLNHDGFNQQNNSNKAKIKESMIMLTIIY